jgi:hypothetical protein
MVQDFKKIKNCLYDAFITIVPKPTDVYYIIYLSLYFKELGTLFLKNC